MKLKLKPKLVEVGRGKNIVILTEDEYERILDALDCIEAERVLADANDPILNWEDVHGRLVSNRIAKVRKSKGITPAELARRLNTRPAAVKRMESKASPPPLDTIENIARALRCRADDLI
jgi:DNA-binding Xre family transcriptional regulator